MNINSQGYWDKVFDSGGWDAVGGRSQTRAFAREQTKQLGISRNFQGTILDFGCGLGDAFPVYREKYPNASLIGVDFSGAAIEQCRNDYGKIAQFVCASYEKCPAADVIIASNVLEHMDADELVAKLLLSKCGDLFVIVPYREQYLIEEHLRSYDMSSFKSLAPTRKKIFASKGWTQYGWKARWWPIHIKNVLRPFFGKPLLRRRMQILFHFKNPNY